jgi:5'-nucleotidase
VVVLLVHEGGNQSGGPGGCVAPTGPIFDIAAALDGKVAVIVSGHSHSAFVCEVGDVVVTQAGDRGRRLDEIALDVDRATGAVLDVTVTDHVITDAITPDADVAAIVAHYEALVAPMRDEVIATITADIHRGPNPGGEHAVGDVVTDAMRAAGGSDVALMNTGGLRDDFVYALSGTETVDGQVTYGEAFAVQPFANLVQSGTLSGADLLAGLDELLGLIGVQVSGMTFAWNPAAPAGQRVVAADVTVGGAPLDVGASYRVTINSIIAQFLTVWANATGVTGDGVDLDLLIPYLTAQSPLSPPPLDRITLTP